MLLTSVFHNFIQKRSLTPSNKSLIKIVTRNVVIKSIEKDTSSSLLLSSHSAREWAQKNPELARKCLETPPPSSLSCSHDITFDTLESYLEYRHWSINTEYSSSRTNYDADYFTNEDNHNAMILLSHTLSYPLTLASQSHIFYPSIQDGNNNEGESCGKYIVEGDGSDSKLIIPIRIACLGARSECSLPTPFWREFLFYIERTNHYKQAIERYHHQLLVDDKTKNTKIEIHWRIDFIGPDVPKGVKPRLISSKDVINNSDNESDKPKIHEQQTSLTLNCHHGYFHEYLQSTLSENDTITTNQLYSSKNKKKNQDFERNYNLLTIWDGFVLFNPGIGHPNLIKDWNYTMNLLIHPNSTTSHKLNAPILFTAHSDLDAQRDIKIIKQIRNKSTLMMEEDIQYTKNPFASRLKVCVTLALDYDNSSLLLLTSLFYYMLHFD